MKKYDTATKEELISKKLILHDARLQLKKEFFGIDSIIDKIVDTIQTWYLIPEMQERPVIINLWGLTGVGKTALVKRLAELINFGNRFYRFDLGESSDNDWKLRYTLRELHEHQNGSPTVICLDEFQYGRTKNALGEIDRSSSRVVWDLLDNGKFQYTHFNSYTQSIVRLKRTLKELDLTKMKVVNGVVVEGKEYFLSRTESGYTKKKPLEEIENYEGLLISEKHLGNLRDLVEPKYNSRLQLREALLELDYDSTLKFLDTAIELSYGPKLVDCTKALVFVLGNLDEVYHMSGEFSPDINADEYRKMSKKINITHVKAALKKRFKNEQIARLGNNHFIYPALGKADYQKIISVELKKYEVQLLDDYNITMQFDKSIHDLLYREGVFPTQGTRPVFTTIQQLVGAHLGNIISHQLANEIIADAIHLTNKEAFLDVTYYLQGKAIGLSKLPLNLSLQQLRANKGDDEQAIVAVHESGHAVLAILLKKKIPISVFSVSADNEMAGFTYVTEDAKLLTRKQVVNHLAFLLGGISAEKLIFGNENISLGSGSDIERATAFASVMIKSAGMGKIVAAVKSQDPVTDDYLHDTTVNDEIRELLSNALQLAEITLTEHKPFLIELSQLLIEKTNIQEVELGALVKKRGLELYLKKDFSPLEILQQLSSSKQAELFSTGNICLNYDSQLNGK